MSTESKKNVDNDRLPVEELTTREEVLLNFVEQHWYTKKGMPSPEQIAKGTGFMREFCAVALQSLPVIYALEDRGIIVTNTHPVLTTVQLRAANLMLNTKDGRNAKRKLEALEITTAQWEGWLRDPVFQDYITQRAENLLGDSLYEAHTSLLSSVRSGDTTALKLYYEMTGRWSSKTVGEVNIEFLMMRIIEIIQREVTDPETLMRIGLAFEALAPQTQPGNLRPGLETDSKVIPLTLGI